MMTDILKMCMRNFDAVSFSFFFGGGGGLGGVTKWQDF